MFGSEYCPFAELLVFLSIFMRYTPHDGSVNLTEIISDKHGLQTKKYLNAALGLVRLINVVVQVGVVFTDFGTLVG